MWNPWKAWRTQREMSDEEYRRQQAEVLGRAPVPLFWLLGKTGSGKTSVVKYLTGADAAEIGNGFRPQTRTSREYEFPSADAPLMRFLDTRGLGEIDYDPAEDLQRFNDLAHLIVVTVRVLDQALAEVVAALKEIRRAKPSRPVLLVLTCLHEAYPQQQHPQPDPFADSLTPDEIPADLRRSIEKQRERFAGLVDRIVPVDLTKPAEGFQDVDFGGQRLKQALLELLPEAYRQTLLAWDEALHSLRQLNERRAMPYVISHSVLAATAGAVPLPWVDIPVVAAIQSHLVYRLARLYGQPLGASGFLTLAGPIGGRLLVRQVVRGVLKFIPYAGIAANAALAYAYTYGLGRACCWYFGQLHAGNAPTAQQLQDVWHQEMTHAAQLWEKTHT